MGVFHQIGHHSINLVGKSGLEGYKGLVCSPVNYNIESMRERNKSFLEKERIFDPQLYYPRTERGVLKGWSYFPNDFETQNLTDSIWWDRLCDELIKSAKNATCNSLCTPTNIPNVFSDAYYDECVRVANYIVSKNIVNQQFKKIYQTAVIDFDTLEAKRPEEIASILTKTECQDIYLVINNNIEPRRELNESTKIVQVMKLIHYLKVNDFNVFVPYCSSDLILWKYAGAQQFSTGKFFNLRRFTSSRFDEPSGGGGQLPYWFDRGLLAFLREGDVLRLLNNESLDESYLENPFSTEILKKINEPRETPWLADSWQFYMRAFMDLDEYTTSNQIIEELVNSAEEKWLYLEDNSIFMEEARNDGSWIRPWKIALAEFSRAVKLH